MWPWGHLVLQVRRQNSRGYEIHTLVIECRIGIAGYPGYFRLLRSSHSRGKDGIWGRGETDLSVIRMLTGRVIARSENRVLACALSLSYDVAFLFLWVSKSKIQRIMESFQLIRKGYFINISCHNNSREETQGCYHVWTRELSGLAHLQTMQKTLGESASSCSSMEVIRKNIKF